MKQQRTHQHDTATRNRDGHFAGRLSRRARTVRAQAPQTMGAWDDSKRAVVLVAVVQMQMDSHHLLKNLGGWLDKDLAGLFRPS